MTILLDHVIVPSRDQDAGARFLGQLLGVRWEEGGHFSPVYVNDTFTLDFGNWENFEPHHYCFHVSDEEFDAIFARIQAAGIKYRSLPLGPDDMTINTGYGGKDVYWKEPDGHIWEMLTVSYARPKASQPTEAAAAS
jgi:catechol 2,3-dioxygenase-like lactoylglutathione lyase family enzyme